MKKIIFSILIASFMYSYNLSAQNLANSMRGTVNEQKEVISMLDSFNIAAANADYKTYFNFFTGYAVFTGTDATERWDKNEYMVWAKPYFDKKKTWNFTSLKRHIYIDPPGTHAWLMSCWIRKWKFAEAQVF